jgi:hypothetical protein
MGEAKRIAAYRASQGITTPADKTAVYVKTASVLEGALARRLEGWRWRAGLTKVQAARVFDVPVQTWYRWIAGGEPTERNRAQLVRVLKASRGSRGQNRRSSGEPTASPAPRAGA